MLCGKNIKNTIDWSSLIKELMINLVVDVFVVVAVVVVCYHPDSNICRHVFIVFSAVNVAGGGASNGHFARTTMAPQFLPLLLLWQRKGRQLSLGQSRHTYRTHTQWTSLGANAFPFACPHCLHQLHPSVWGRVAQSQLDHPMRSCP